ncbi:MAG: phosphoribosylamine--glycine ligase [Christensenellales bacterium]
MDVLVVGGGGREHAIIRALKQSPEVGRLYALPGNGGIAQDAVCVDIPATDIAGIVRFARENKVGFAVVAPDDPLVLGCVDALEAIGVPCFGPRANAAILEGSKAFAKDLMRKYGIPTAASETFDELPSAAQYIARAPLPMVIKADGLALGKGVVICQTREEALSAATAMLEGGAFGASGKRIVIEEFLEGVEVTVLAFADGETVVPMVSAMDHKRAGEGDTGLNTGGMGAIAPNPYYTDAIAARCMDEIYLPTVRAMKREGREFRGCIYFGLMLTADGPKVIEYNCRFGDPEAQAVLPLMQTDLFAAMRATAEGQLAAEDVRFYKNRHACCVVVASKGYPEQYDCGYALNLPEVRAGEYAFVAGARQGADGLISAGGRVVGMTAVDARLETAIARAYALAARVGLANKYIRRDIGARAMEALSYHG